MPGTLFWVNKHASSSCLSQSYGPDESKIRRHAQQRRWARARQNNLQNSCSNNLLTSQRTEYAARLDHKATQGRLSQKSLAAAQSVPYPTLIASRLELQRITELSVQNCQLPIPGKVSSNIEVNLSVQERRGLDFFVHCTAPDWAGWEDAPLWNDIALRLSYSNQTIAHALVALSALHESRLSSDDWGRRSSLAALSFRQRDRAINAGGNKQQTSHLEALVSCLTLICLQNVQNGHHSFRLLEAGRRMLDECSSGRLNHSERLLVDQYVRPLFSRLRGRLCMMNDPAQALRTSIRRRREFRPWPVLSQPCIPQRFNAQHQARDLLSQFFTWAHDLMVVSDDSWNILSLIRKTGNAWHLALHQTSPADVESGIAGRALLEAAYLFGIILLETFQCQFEVVFDRYTNAFAQLIEAVEQAQGLINLEGLHRERSTSFGIDNGLVDIVAFTGQKCRDPHIRRRALNILMQSGRVEGGRLACTAGMIMKTLISKEEQGISKINSATDVPATQRWHILRGEQYFRFRKIRLLLRCRLASEADEFKNEECWIDLPENVSAVDPDVVREGLVSSEKPGPPDTIFGCGFVSFLEDRDSISYLKVEHGEFFFPIPRA